MSVVAKPPLGRFIEQDSVEGAVDKDYTYVLDPINRSDLDGQICWSCAWRNVKKVAKAVHQ